MKESGTEFLFAERALNSLRFRLAAAMLLVQLGVLGASSVLDRLGQVVRRVAPGLAALLNREPYQDGLVLGCFSVAVVVLIWFVSVWSLRPLSRASEEAALAGPEHPGIRISATRLPTEIRPLVAAVNGALDRLEAAYETERRFTADAAHELRTPLSILSLRLQQARTAAAPDWPAIEHDLAQMTRLVARLLDLARKEQAANRAGDLTLAEVNLSRIAREAAAMILPLAEVHGRALLVDLPTALTLRGRADDLRDMVLSLLENAILHGQGTISLSGGRNAAGLTLTVADEGRGIAGHLREEVFERFRKASPGSPGTGLGLAIVREVARAHGGWAEFHKLPPTRVCVSLPAPCPPERGAA